MIGLRSMACGCTWLATVVIAATVARGAATFTFSPAGDGGVVLVADGDAGTTSPFDDVYTVELDTTNVLGPDGGNYLSSTVSGSITFGGGTESVVYVTLSTVGSTADNIILGLSDFVSSGSTTFNNVTASWPVGTLAFSTLTPGTYQDTLSDSTITVVPEPASAGLLAVAGVALLTGCGRRRLRGGR